MTTSTVPVGASAPSAGPADVPPLGSARRFLRDSGIVFRRQLRMNLRNPAWVIIGMLQPVLYLLLFGPLLEPLIGQLGATNAYTFFVPGMLVQLGVFGAFFAGFSLIGEWREGVIEAERVTPANRTALLVGRLYRDLLQLLVQALILVGLGFALGMDASVGGLVLGVLLTLLLGGACAAASNALALTTKSEDVMAPVINMVMLPVLLLSGILLPMTIGPAWLQTASDFMPIRWVVDGVRTSFAGDLASSTLLWGTVWALGLFAAAVWWGTATFRRENA
ncbi:ABC transporter permease [Cellulomonas marina]|uniref:Transport permease protein n=1 Tax=Cellulomonas marina TaxID=988821 RepID=A0A1I0ZFK4_9CELL|nr:ABC transporter permease [Cellulomonas marina]GIG30627.1 transport permease protein [Cellulomonas marina]SFB22973.1 ABC-2 type transport system permease protein [Cellulomonas marina]